MNIKRPPSAAQHGVYTASCRGPPTQVNTAMKPRPFSAKARITTERVAEKTTAAPKTRPPWRPFSGHAALGRTTPLINKNPKNANVMAKEEAHYDLPSLSKVYQDRYKYIKGYREGNRLIMSPVCIQGTSNYRRNSLLTAFFTTFCLIG